MKYCSVYVLLTLHVPITHGIVNSQYLCFRCVNNRFHWLFAHRFCVSASVHPLTRPFSGNLVSCQSYFLLIVRTVLSLIGALLIRAVLTLIVALTYARSRHTEIMTVAVDSIWAQFRANIKNLLYHLAPIKGRAKISFLSFTIFSMNRIFFLNFLIYSIIVSADPRMPWL